MAWCSMKCWRSLGTTNDEIQASDRKWPNDGNRVQSRAEIRSKFLEGPGYPSCVITIPIWTLGDN